MIRRNTVFTQVYNNGRWHKIRHDNNEHVPLLRTRGECGGGGQQLIKENRVIAGTLSGE